MTLLLKNWHFARVLRAFVAIWFFVEFSRSGEWIFLFPASLFALQAILNVSCCGANGCTPTQQRTSARTEEDKNIIFEEVKP
jgi:hypothetical protein